MKRATLLTAAVLASAAATRFTPPPTKTNPVTETLHGVAVTDPYRWLEDQESPETRAWIEAQRKYAEDYLAALPQREAFRKAIRASLERDTVSRPTVRNGRYFFTRRRATESRASILVREGVDGRERVLLDPAAINADERVTVQMRAVSRDGTILAYGIRQGGEDETDVRLLNTATGQPLKDVLPRARYWAISMKPDNSGFYYGKIVARQGSRVYYHRLGADPATDQEVFGEGYGLNDFVSVTLSENGRWMVYGVRQGVPARRSEIYIQDLKDGTPRRTLLKEDDQFDSFVRGDRLYLWTKWKAPNWRVIMVDLTRPEPANWKEVIPEGKWPIEEFSAGGGRLFAVYLENVSSKLREYDPDGKLLREIPLPGIGTVTAPAGRWEDDDVFYTFTSFTTPQQIFRYVPSKMAQSLWFETKSTIDTSKITVEQVWYSSKDRTRVPMFVIRRTDLPRDGKRPALLTGYGGFNSSSTPFFSSNALVWTAAGGVYAVPNLRGGGEFGDTWHRAGMFEKKQNVFDDFHAAAEWLIANRYTSRDHLAIMGASNGGLLVGAALTQRPELFRAVVCGAPLLDMLRYHKLKVGSWWSTEYGSADDPKQFEYLRKYSPYHNVRNGVHYPAVLFTTGDADTRVDPSHARKMAALLQAAAPPDRPVMLRYDVAGGHIGGISVQRTSEQSGDALAFLAAQVGLRLK